jgi:hypothetical protein
MPEYDTLRVTIVSLHGSDDFVRLMATHQVPVLIRSHQSGTVMSPLPATYPA